jgi:hypothetical protein
MTCRAEHLPPDTGTCHRSRVTGDWLFFNAPRSNPYRAEPGRLRPCGRGESLLVLTPWRQALERLPRLDRDRVVRLVGLFKRRAKQFSH